MLTEFGTQETRPIEAHCTDVLAVLALAIYENSRAVVAAVKLVDCRK